MPWSTEEQQKALPGRLARVIATRGGLAPPEAPFVIEHREALIYMLYEAAELEHGIMCQYLFAAFSLKQSVDEGLTEMYAVKERVVSLDLPSLVGRTHVNLPSVLGLPHGLEVIHAPALPDGP